MLIYAMGCYTIMHQSFDRANSAQNNKLNCKYWQCDVFPVKKNHQSHKYLPNVVLRTLHDFCPIVKDK